MIIVRLRGGLGNQMFQYAWGLRLARHHSCRLAVDTSFLLDHTPKTNPSHVYRGFDLDIFSFHLVHCIPLSVARILSRFKKRKINQWMFRRALRGHLHIKEKRIGLDYELLDKLPSECLLDGYWQSPHYFEPIADELRDRIFQFRYSMSAEAQKLKAAIQSESSICLNVRRTDFLTNQFHGALSKDYFDSAVKKMGESISKPKIYVFSDDIPWCRENLQFPYETVVVDHRFKGYKFASYLELMSACRHFIIPNSTFAWWAAWMGRHTDKRVIAPKRWFNPTSEADFYGSSDFDREGRDLIPGSWERL